MFNPDVIDTSKVCHHKCYIDIGYLIILLLIWGWYVIIEMVYSYQIFDNNHVDIIMVSQYRNGILI